jgi:acetyl-CoA/propionyl-CoA carboxylase biotin carboxyl carrier protein
LVAVEVDGRSYDVTLVTAEPAWAPLARRRRGRSAGLHGGGVNTITSPMQGTVLKVDVAEGESISAGQVVCVVEAMKMENEIVSHRDGVVRGLAVVAGEPIASGQLVCHVEDE